MLMLALESSAKTASAALFEDGTFLGQYFQSDGLTHSCTLLPMAQSLVKNTGRTLRQLSPAPLASGLERLQRAERASAEPTPRRPRGG